MAIWDYPRAMVMRVLDGDTFWAHIDHGCRIFSEQKVRLKDFSAPELKDPGGPEAREALLAKLPAGLVVRVRSYRWTYDRLESDVWYFDESGVEINLNETLRNPT